MLIDRLVMLLSCDWFLPYWSEIGVQLDESRSASIQLGTRTIIPQILGAADEYYHIDFSAERQQETRLLLDSLIGNCEAGNALTPAVLEWSELSDEDEKAAWICSSLTDDLVDGEAHERDPWLNPEIHAVLRMSVQPYTRDAWEFSEICEASKTTWDKYLKRLTPEQPSALADALGGFLTARRYRIFWESICPKLTQMQRHELFVWYRATARVRGRREIIPSYMSSSR
jgi:hypothetical protein